MERKQHDIFMDMASNPEATLDNLVVAGLTAANTSLQDKDTYKNDEWVKQLFTNSDGTFNQRLFDTFYNNATIYYNLLAQTDYDKAMAEQVSYHKDNIFAPVDKLKSGPDYKEILISNPFQITNSVILLGKEGLRTLSIDELALQSKVLLNPLTAGENLENAEWGDSPNDSFWSYFSDTLVQAQYDTDGTHIDPITKLEVDHKAGDLKLDLDGNFYYEKLSGRDIYGRRVLNKMNVLTTDGSWANKFDFFDSDDLEQKSIGGTALKELALVGSMFIPYVGPYIAGLSIATLTAGLLGTLGKMLTGSDNEFFSELEGWAKSVGRQGAVTEYALNNTWCWENFINLIGDVAGLLKEQRFIFEKAPLVFKGSNVMTESGQAKKLKELEQIRLKLANIKIKELKNSSTPANELLKTEASLRVQAAKKALADLESFVKGYNKLGEILSKGYMTAVTVGDTYGEAKLAGASDIDATALTLGYAAAEYALLSTGIGEWILPELRAGRYKALAITKALTEQSRNTLELRRLFGSSLANVPKEGKKEYIKNLFNIGKNIARAEYANGTKTLTATLASGAGEGFEEVSEELLADFSKGCYDVVKWLSGEDTRINTFGYDFKKSSWNSKEVLDRYGMSLIGGFVGGGVTNAAMNYKMIDSFNNMTPEKAIQEIVYMARNGQTKDFLKLLHKSLVGDTNLSTDYYIEDGNIVFKPGTKENNQDVYIKRAVTNLVLLIEAILAANGATSDNIFLDALTLGDLRFNALHQSTTAGLYLQEYNTLNSDIVKLVGEIRNITNSGLDSNKDGNVSDKEERRNKLSPEKQEILKKLESELKEKKTLLDDLLSGKRAGEFISTALFEMTPALSSLFTTITFPAYAELKFKKKYSELTENEKEIARKTYELWKTTDLRERLRSLSDLYRQISEQSSEVLKKYSNAYLSNSEELSLLDKAVAGLYRFVDGGSEADWLDMALSALDASMANFVTRLTQILGTELDAEDLKNILNRDLSKLSEDEKKKQLDQISKDYKAKLEEILLNNISNFVKPFIDRGFANQETRNQLSNLIKLALNLVNKKAIEWDMLAEENYDPLNTTLDVNPYIDLLKSLESYKAELSLLSSTPIEGSLDLFSISIGNEAINLSELIAKLNNSFNTVSLDITRFNIDLQLYKDLNNAIYTMQMYRAAILGARTDAANVFSNLFGYNATLNEVASKLNGYQSGKLAEIDSVTADIFIEDINANLNKLTFLKLLYEINQGLKLTRQDRVSTKKDLLIYKRLKSIVQVPDNDELKTWNGFLELLNVINGATLHESLLNSNDLTLLLDQKEEFEKEQLAIENAIYDFFLKNSDKLKDVNELVKFINPKRFQLYTEATELLNEGLDNIDDNSIVWWLASRIAVRASDFYSEYRQIIDPNSEHPLAPITTLELAIYNNYASILNGEVFTQIYKALRQSLKEDWKNKSIADRNKILSNLGRALLLSADKFADYYLNFLPVPRYSNITLTEGIPGSGKSTGVFQSTIKLLKQFHPEVLKKVYVVHGASSNSATELRDNVGLTSESSSTFDREKFMKEINSNWVEYKRDESTESYLVPDNHYIITDENEIRSSLGINETSTPPSLIIIDEISKFSAYDLDLIDKFAQKYGITVLVAGDFDQSGVVGQHTVNIAGLSLSWEIDLSRTAFARSPKLGVSMRTDNSIKTLNLQKLQAYMLNPTLAISFEYYEDETGLYGDKVRLYGNDMKTSGALDATLSDIDKLIDTLKEGLKIGYIYSNKLSPLYQVLSSDKYKPYIDFKEGGSALGLEAQYYVIETNSTASLKTYLKDLYTGISRALLGSIVVASTDVLGIKLDSKRVNEKISEEVPTNVILNFALKRKELLEKVVLDGKKTEITPRLNSTVKPILLNPQPSPKPTTTLPPALPPAKTEPNSPRDVTDFTINIDGQDIQLLLDLIPYVDYDRKSGYTNMVNFINRNIVVVNINGFHMPFYMTTGHGGKIETVDGTWYPFLGIGDDTWLNKTTGKELSEYYNSPILKAIAEKLNEVLGTGYHDQYIGVPVSNEYKDGAPTPHIDFINQDLDPIESSTPKAYDIVTKNINEVINIITLKINDLKNTGVSELPKDLEYENNEAPIVQTDITVEPEYKERLDGSNVDTELPENTVEATGNSIIIDMLLHSFNTFESGVLTDSNGMPVGSQEWMDARIDSVNGLIKLDKLLGHEIRTTKEYINIIGSLRSILFNTSDKSDLVLLLQDLLGIQEIYCTFALKSSPTAGTLNRQSGREYVGNTPNPFEKGISELTLYNGSTDERSKEWNPKSIVAIIGNKLNGNIVELPLLTMSSPFTLIQTKDENGVRVFNEMYNRFLALLTLGVNLHNISETLVQEFSSRQKYSELVDLFKLYNFTDGAVFYIRDQSWTPSNSLQLLGPKFLTHAGYYLNTDGLIMNDETNPEDEWLTLEDFALNPQITMTKKVMLSLSGYVDGIDRQIVLPGHSFVLVSFNKKLNTDNKIIEQWIKQEKDSSVRKEVKLMYVLPPSASIGEYINNVYNIITKNPNVLPIGNLFTSYKLLNVLIKNLDFRNLLELKIPNLVGKVEEAINELNALDSLEDLKNLLYTPREWTEQGFKKTKLAGLFDSVLLNTVSTRNTLNSMIGGENTFEIDDSALSIVEKILVDTGISKIYYNVKLPKEAATINSFYYPSLEAGYRINGVPFKIHGKLDSYTFKGRMGGFVSYALSTLRNLKNSNHLYSTDSLSYWDWKTRSGNSSLSNKPKLTEELKKINNIVEYIKKKTGKDVSSRYSNGKPIFEVNNELVKEINSENNQLVAFIIGDTIKISHKSTSLEGTVYIYDILGSPISNISHTDDNNGQFQFIITVENNGTATEFNATYNSITDEMVLLQQTDPVDNNVVLSVTPEIIEDYLESGRELLEPLFDFDPSLAEVFEKTTYEEFIQALEEMEYIGEDRINDLLELKLNADALLEQIINDLILLEESHNPDNETEVCPTNIKIKF